MPCGGIYPLSAESGKCFHCDKDGAKHFCEEWDCFIHARCALVFLSETQEGKIVIHHGHEVILNFDIESEGGEDGNPSSN